MQREADEDDKAIEAQLPGEDGHYREEEVKRFYGWPDEVWAGMCEHERAVKRVHWREYNLRKGLRQWVTEEHFKNKAKK